MKFDDNEAYQARHVAIQRLSEWGVNYSGSVRLFRKCIPKYSPLGWVDDEVDFYKMLSGVNGYAIFRTLLVQHNLDLKDLQG